MYPFFTTTGKMKVSEAMPLLNFIAADWSQRLQCNTKEQTMLSFGKSFTVCSRILKHSTRNN